jgi:hypothetical protein
MTDWYSSVYKGFIMTGILAIIIGFFSSGEISINSYISGFSIIILGLLMIMIFFIKYLLQPSNLTPSILVTIGPFLLMIGVMSFMLYLLINYRTNIVEQKATSGYYAFSTIFMILLLSQLYMVYININSPKFEETVNITKLTSSIIYLFGVLETITSIIIYTMLSYFRTDGFTCLN